MVRDRGTPGVKHAEKADLGPQLLGVGGDRLQRLTGSTEENVINLLLILIGNSRREFWDRKRYENTERSEARPGVSPTIQHELMIGT